MLERYSMQFLVNDVSEKEFGRRQSVHIFSFLILLAYHAAAFVNVFFFTNHLVAYLLLAVPSVFLVHLTASVPDAHMLLLS